MPNQRSKDKEFVGVHVTKDLKNALAAIAKRQGRTVTDVVTGMFEDAAASYGIDTRSEKRLKRRGK